MTASEARAMTTGLSENLEKYIHNIDESIREAARNGRRQVEPTAYVRSYANDIVDHYRTNGFHVQHITAPFVNIIISW